MPLQPAALSQFAIAQPLDDQARYTPEPEGGWDDRWMLSRFTYQRVHEGQPIVESILSQFRIQLLDSQAGALFSAFLQSGPYALPTELQPLHEKAIAFWQLLGNCGFLLPKDQEPDSHKLWEFHSALFHYHQLAYQESTGKVALPDVATRFPIYKPLMSSNLVPLPVPGPDQDTAQDRTFSEVMENRVSLREHDPENPITLAQLSDFLYRSARVQRSRKMSEETGIPLSEQSRGDDDVLSTLRYYDDTTQRPYPSASSLYELEIYPIIHQCQGLAAGAYHYDPQHHQLVKLDIGEEVQQKLLGSGKLATLKEDLPQVYFVITARFGRLFWKYHDMGYGLVLKHIGALMQNFYLAASSLDLAPCAIGKGPRYLFSEAIGANVLEEASVGEFILGSKPPSHPAKATDQPQVSSASEATASASDLARSSFDLGDRIPGLNDLRAQTKGNAEITVAILDGDPDYAISALNGPLKKKVFPYWHPSPVTVTAADYQRYREVKASDLPPKEKDRLLAEELGESVFNQADLNTHACSITSIIGGEENSALEGIAPHCRLINIPMMVDGDMHGAISTLNLVRALELAIELGADVIHFAACQPSQYDQSHELLDRAIRRCQEENILIMAPGGNDFGKWRCLPASLPGTLAVGAMDDNNTPLNLSNWGGNYSKEGLLVLGKDVWSALPHCEDIVTKTGTSLAAPILSGIVALLASLQHSRTGMYEAASIRQALLDTALPCQLAEDQAPEQGLAGRLNLPGALHALFPDSFPKPSPTSPSSTDAVTASAVEAETSVLPEGKASLPGLAYVLGIIDYDFESHQDLDRFGTKMPVPNGSLKADPLDKEQFITFLEANPDMAIEIVWTLKIDDAVAYTLKPTGAFAVQIHARLLQMLKAFHRTGSIEIACIPGFYEGNTGTLRDGDVVPELNVPNVRGMYGWRTQDLVTSALGAVPLPDSATAEDQETLRGLLTDFLGLVYYQLRNTGRSSSERALNFAVVNTFQSAYIFANAFFEGYQFLEVYTEKSPFCRLYSDCWVVIFAFRDPEDEQRARKEFRFTIDVSDLIPVTMGEVKEWSVQGSL